MPGVIVINNYKNMHIHLLMNIIIIVIIFYLGITGNFLTFYNFLLTCMHVDCIFKLLVFVKE